MTQSEAEKNEAESMTLTESGESMTCEGCDKCCRCIIFNTILRDDIELSKARGFKVEKGHTIIPTVCPHLKDGKCSIYDRRPLLCRTFKKGDNLCQIVLRMD